MTDTARTRLRPGARRARRHPPRAGEHRRRRRPPRRPRRPGDRADRAVPPAHRPGPPAHRRGHRRPRRRGRRRRRGLTSTAVPPAPPPTLATIAARTDACLDELLTAERARWAAARRRPRRRRSTRSSGWSAPAASGCGRRSATGAFVGAGGDPDDQRVVRAGAAFELMHAFALFHDDVMDDSASRRGAPTTHAVYADEHGRATWAGESRRFGEGRGDPGRRPRLRARRSAADRRPAGGLGPLERAAHRAQRRAVPRPARLRAAGTAPRQGRAHRPLQERQVHDRAAAPRRRRARRARAPGRAAARAEPLRAAAR